MEEEEEEKGDFRFFVFCSLTLRLGGASATARDTPERALGIPPGVGGGCGGRRGLEGEGRNLPDGAFGCAAPSPSDTQQVSSEEG